MASGSLLSSSDRRQLAVTARSDAVRYTLFRPCTRQCSYSELFYSRLEYSTVTPTLSGNFIICRAEGATQFFTLLCALLVKAAVTWKGPRGGEVGVHRARYTTLSRVLYTKKAHARMHLHRTTAHAFHGAVWQQRTLWRARIEYRPRTSALNLHGITAHARYPFF